MSRPKGFLQVDVDGLWAVRACYNRPEGNSFREDPCWSEGVPRLDSLFQKAGIPASFFLVGRDLEIDAKRRIARKLIHRGYEIGNHSYTHRIGLTLEPAGLIKGEITRTHRSLLQIGAAPRGFRSPGYDIDARIVRLVRAQGYLYDASILPTYLSPVLRLADAWLAQRWNPGKRQFGRIAYGRAPRKPYRPLPYKLRKPAPPDRRVPFLEIPVGTTPGMRLPLTGASLLPLSRGRLATLFERLAAKRRPVLLLLHAIDGTDCSRPIVFRQRRPRLGGFAMSGEEKERRLRRIVEEFSRAFDVVRADEYARRRLDAEGLRE